MSSVIVTEISLFPRGCPRRRILEALMERPKTLSELTAESTLNGGKSYVWKILKGMEKLGFVKKFGEGKVIYYSITQKGVKFLKKESIEEVL